MCPLIDEAGDELLGDTEQVAGRWTYLYRAVDQHRQVIDVLLSQRRDGAAARALFTHTISAGRRPVEVSTDRAPVYPRILDEVAPSARHVVQHYANNAIEADHGLLKARLRPMHGLKRIRSASTIAAGHAFAQNLRRGHYKIGGDEPPRDRSVPHSSNSRSAADRSPHLACSPRSPDPLNVTAPRLIF